MVFKKSEYRKQYRDPRWDSHFSHYKEKVDYRIQRRCQEHHHQILDWDWDSENGTEEDYNLNNNSNLAGPPRRSGMEGRGGDVSDKTVQTPEWSRTREMPPQQPNEPPQQPNEPPQQPNDRYSEPHEQKDAEQAKGHTQKARHQKETSKDRRRARPKTAPGQRVDMKKAKTDHHPPLVAFGWADQELTTGAKKTHNIRASADIYPSALRAMRRRELEIQRETSRSAGKNLREQKLKAVFNIPPRDDSVWLTEYQRNFAGPTRPR